MDTLRVAVIGGSGFIGRHIVQHLAERGAVITVLARAATHAGYLVPMGDVGQIALVNADIDDTEVIDAAFQGVHAVVNATGILFERGRQTFARIHAEGPDRLARLAAKAGIRHFVHLSAIGADQASDSAYARSKAMGEKAVRDACPQAVILRPSLVFGPEDQFFNRFARLASLLPALPLIGGGATRFQPVYVADIAKAVMAALERADATGKIFELGGPGIYSFKALMEILLHEIRRKRLLIPLPWSLAMLQASLLEWLPGTPPLTRDQVKLLRHDNVVAPGMPGFPELGLPQTSLELILPTYLDRFRRPGLPRR
ncbi:MAG TPA: complex I NDUFA9 subunit family protein [Stellaceae bacterium]|nr:complex I NDUFA9 subunit family protein [Stellaceae bacterium]